jgi:ParB family transcriptional regulator, chromosome partitioning protein
VPPRKSATKPQLRNVAALLNRETTAQSEPMEQAPRSIDLDKIQLPSQQRN